MNGATLCVGMHRDEIDRQFDEIVAFAEIERFLDTPVKRYSSGTPLARAPGVVASSVAGQRLEPEILLVDEVLAVGGGCAVSEEVLIMVKYGCVHGWQLGRKKARR